jgi:hypothetical protein
MLQMPNKTRFPLVALIEASPASKMLALITTDLNLRLDRRFKLKAAKAFTTIKPVFVNNASPSSASLPAANHRKRTGRMSNS